MTVAKSDAETLRTILEQIQNPELFNAHPWVSRPFVQEVASESGLRRASSGQHLVGAIEILFQR